MGSRVREVIVRFLRPPLVVLEVARPITPEEAQRIREAWDRATHGVPAVVLTGGMRAHIVPQLWWVGAAALAGVLVGVALARFAWA